MQVFLDPFGQEQLGLILIVPKETGVVYSNQCGGTSCQENALEGFIVPLGYHGIEEEIYKLFDREFRENCYPPHNMFSESFIQELNSILARVELLSENERGEEVPSSLSLDIERISECIEAWIPVKSVHGQAILTLKNSD